MKAVGEGRAMGNTGAWTYPPDGGDVAGNRGNAEQWAAITTLCTGKRKTCSFGVGFVEVMARTCVGCVGREDDDDERWGMANF